ncbi:MULTISPECIES: polyprenyl synthetase family protein [Leuconostoc]|uniref:Geranyltranstransferase n=2 Tax=Leuconostoc kimchii TaxID=136609 RepID=D5T1B7_LEUKI|nr:MULTISPECIES: polyprenyl synthetase family protein [Leuconostoc]ADG40066.1 geranyltranstransferase [Leuconostoc kimchii IMSNU 11154]AEJ30136.1 geranyltranstransferase [Leuconostoc sp. C2]QBR47225.1 polyprenyl synthetase family protein [Leuconostoc kimchii]
MTRLAEFQSEWIPKLNQQLEDDLTRATNDSEFSDMMKYAVLNGGKRLRPMLSLAAMACFGQKITPSFLKAATAVEWVHSYSLVHDDLPAMDNDLVRRGKPSVHAQFGEAEAILVGDALLTGAFHVLATANDSVVEDEMISAVELLKLSQILSVQSGSLGMVIGQVHDMYNHGKQSKIDETWLIDEVYMPKTGALLGFSALAGTRLSNQQDIDQIGQDRFDTNLAMLTFGYDFGIAFQIQDDLDDFDQDDTEDIMSLPHLIGVPAATQKRDSYLRHARQMLSDVSRHNSKFDRTLLDDFLNLIGDNV